MSDIFVQISNGRKTNPARYISSLFGIILCPYDLRDRSELRLSLWFSLADAKSDANLTPNQAARKSLTVMESSVTEFEAVLLHNATL